MTKHFKISLIFLELIIATLLVSNFKSVENTPNETVGIQWVTWDEAIKLSKKKPKKIFVDVYTNWCGWCKKMDVSTFQNKEIGEYMNKNFYCIKFNAEGKDSITIGGVTYSNAGKTHQLARDLLDNKMSYPTVVFLDESFSKLTPVPGYRAPTDFLHIARYIGDNVYKTKTWEQYNANTSAQ